MAVINTRLCVGAEKPFEVIHLSDTHLTFADMRDGKRKVDLAEGRMKVFPKAAETLAAACALSAQKGVPIIHTGDLMDFVSLANIEKVKEFTDANDCFLAAGNHEFSLYVGEAKEDAAYRNQSLAAVQSAFKNDIRMSSRTIGGVNFVVLDNGYYLFEKEQLEFLKNEVDKGLPVVLLLHTPLFDKKLYDVMMADSECAYLAGVPEDLMHTYTPHRYEQQKADEITDTVIDYIAGEAGIKAVVAGHLHINYEGTFADRIPQIVTDCPDIRIIEFC